MYSQTSEERRLWDSGICPLLRGFPLLGGCLIYPPRITRERVNRGAGYGLKIPCAYQFFGLKPCVNKLREVVNSPEITMKVSTVQNSEVVTSQRLLIYNKYRILNLCLRFCPL